VVYFARHQSPQKRNNRLTRTIKTFHIFIHFKEAPFGDWRGDVLLVFFLLLFNDVGMEVKAVPPPPLPPPSPHPPSLPLYFSIRFVFFLFFYFFFLFSFLFFLCYALLSFFF
jgi:hypothetical protein